MREKEVRGKPVITFIGGGYESRQAVRRKVHQYLGTWTNSRLRRKLPKRVSRPNRWKLRKLLIEYLEASEWSNTLRPSAFTGGPLSGGMGLSGPQT